MTDISVSVHELKAHLSEFLSRSVHGNSRIIIRRHNQPLTMIIPFAEGAREGKGGLGSIDWTLYTGIASDIDRVHAARQDEAYREVSF